MRGRFGCERSVAAEGLVALGLSGELDIETVPIFEAAMQRVLADAPATAVLELHGLEFLDSTGLRAILAAHERLRGHSSSSPTAVAMCSSPLPSPAWTPI